MQRLLKVFTSFLNLSRPRPAQRLRLALFSTFAMAAVALSIYALIAPPKARGLSSGVVISQVYGGGGNTGATYTHDYIELFNRGNSPVSINGWSVQYASATGSAWTVTNLPNVSINPGQYYLIQEAPGTGGTTALPTPDLVVPAGPQQIALSGTNGKVALVNNSTALTCGASAGNCFPNANIIDFLGYGTANNSETSPVAALTNTTAARRKAGGCTETDNNSTDFENITAFAVGNPRNTSSPINPCTPLTPTLNINDVALNEGNAGPTTFSFTISLTSSAPVGGVSFTTTTANNTATTGDNDYVFKTQNLTILEGQMSATFDVEVNGDTTFEPNETFFVNITGVTGATLGDGQGQGTINNDDVSPLPLLSINDVSLAEGNAGTTTFTFTVSLSAPAGAGGVTFDIATADGTATTANNDYVAASQMGQSIAMGQSSTTFDVTVNGDTTGEPDETFTVNVTNISGAALSDGTGLGTIQNDDLTFTLIHDIQGTTDTPNFVGTTRTIQGIVVGDFQTASALTGFFVEEESADWDADANTSEGIFVADPAVFVNVAVGDRVTVTGTVANTFGLTQISPTAGVVINASGQTLPSAQTLTLPVAATGDFEKFEGMLVQFAAGQVITDTNNLGRFGEFTISGANRLYQPTNSIDPNDNPASGTTTTGATNAAAVTAQQTTNNLSRLIVDDGSNVTNTGGLSPIPFIGAGPNATLRPGDVANGLIGVMNFAFSNYRLEVTAPPIFTAGNPRSMTPPAVGSGNLKIVSFNVENYFVGPFPDPTGRGASNAAEFTRQRDKLISAMVAMNADVIGLIELEKNDGNAAAADLAAALTTAMGGGANTYAAVADLATLVGTDTEIKNGMIYRTSAVTAVGAPLTDTTATAGTYSRDPLTQRFNHTATNQQFFVSVNHFRSRSCSGASGADADQGDGQGCFNARRKGQSTALVNFIANTLTPIDPDVIVLGDLNAYSEEDPLDIFRAAGFKDVLDQFSTAADRYSFIFDQQVGSLEGSFVSSSLMSNVTGASIWHINADEPDIFDYNTENKPDDRYAATPFRSADHDPVLIGLNFGALCPNITVTPSTVPAGTAGSAYGPVQFMQTGGGGTIIWSVTSNNLPAGLTLNPMTGQLSGTPSVAVGVNVTIRATDSNNCFGEVTVTLQINCPTITISPSAGSPTALTGGTIGQMYSQTFTAAPAGGSYTYSIPAPSIPPGLTFNSSTGELSGMPTTTGTFSFTVTATGFGTCGGTQNYSLTIGCQTITVTPAGPALPTGMVGSPYSQQLTANNANGSINFTLQSGSFPAPVTMSLSGLISGTPTQSGTFNFTVRATDGNNCFVDVAYTLVINPPCGTINVSPMVAPNGFVGTAYSATFSGGGGTAPYGFTISAGAQPTGLTLSSGGALTGTPTATGTFNFTVKATDANGCMGTQAYTVIISGSGLQFYPLPAPVRLLDTRSGAGISGCTIGTGVLAANTTRTEQARTACSMIPSNATAVIGNITVVPNNPGFLTLYPADATQPTVANSNFRAGEVTNNFFTVGLATTGMDLGAFKIFAGAETHVVIDLTGYYAPPGAGGLFYHPLPTPVRLVETRSAFDGCFKPAQLMGTGNPNANPNLDLPVQGRSPGVPSPCNSIPSDAAVLVGNATTVTPSGGGYLTIYPSDATRPTIASSNYAGSDAINGPFAVKLGADGQFKVYTLTTTDLVIDITGYYSASPTDANGAGLLFSPLPKPLRLLETRPDLPSLSLVGCYRPNAPIAGGMAGIRTQQVWGLCSDQPITIPNTARAIVGNATVVSSTGAGFLTFFPGDAATAPVIATSNYPSPATFGYNRHYYVGLSPANGTFKILTHFTTDLVVDVSGYFEP